QRQVGLVMAVSLPCDGVGGWRGARVRPGWTHPAAPTPVRPPPGSRTRKPVRARGFEPRVFPVSPVAVVRAPLASGAQCPDVGRVGRAALIAPAPALVRHDLTVC